MLIRFLRDHRGSIAPMLAFTAIPLMGGVGVAVDYSRANATKAQFQAALDSTALMSIVWSDGSFSSRYSAT